MSARLPIVAIDGPAGAGKSTVSRQVARRLGFLYVDTGAMYRAIALKADALGALDNAEALVRIARESDVKLQPQPDGALRVLLDGADVTEAIRSVRVGHVVSAVSAIAGVRNRMVELQRSVGASGGIVMEGRDIQTVVFPEAEVKIFLTASPTERARRRCAEMQARGEVAEMAAVEADLRARDDRDSTRAESPLAAASGARELPTDGLTIEQVVDRIVAIVQEYTKER